jgi:phosphatidylglycerophosphatase C
VARQPGDLKRLTERELLDALDKLARAEPNGLLAFDGDGTLWAGDVGEDVFHAATEGGLLKEAAREALAREALAFNVPADVAPSQIAKNLGNAYLAGRYPERDVCAVMTWCYAGFTRGELIALTQRTFAARGLAGRLRLDLKPVFDFARRAGLRIVVVSASPQVIVEQAVALWGISADDVVASRPALDGEIILPRLASPVPYAEEKPVALRSLAPETPILAAFGDNVFDIELLRAASLAVAVHPKPALRARLAALDGIWLFES